MWYYSLFERPYMYIFPICIMGASVRYVILFKVLIYCLVINRYQHYMIELFILQRRFNTSVRVLIFGVRVPCSGLGRSLGDLLARPPLLPVRSWPHICSEVTAVHYPGFHFRQYHKRNLAFVMTLHYGSSHFDLINLHGLTAKHLYSYSVDPHSHNQNPRK